MAQEDVAPIRVGLLGAGTVGSQTARLLVEQKDELAARIGRPIELTGVACLDPAETDPFPWIDKAIVTTDTMSVATNSDIVIELIGGTGVARKFVLAAIESGASVVTANKALLAKYGPEIYAAAEAKGVDIYFEASVGGAIPFLKPLRESLVGDKVTSMLGIVNGTTNYILTRMSKEGAEYADVLADAQRLGLAEPDPASDVEGLDAAYKLSILASLAFHGRVPFENVYVEGITQVQAEDIRCGQELGYTLKLLAIAKRNGLKVETRVHPTFIRNDHPLANISGAFNAVFLHGHACGEMMFMGRGAGDLPTASAIVSDLVRAASAQKHLYPTFDNELHPAVSLQNNTDWRCAFYTRMLAKDEPGVLSRIAQTFADHGVSIAAMQQKGEQRDGRVTVVFITHQASERDMQKAILEIRPEVATVESLLRVE